MIHKFNIKSLQTVGFFNYGLIQLWYYISNKSNGVINMGHQQKAWTQTTQDAVTKQRNQFKRELSKVMAIDVFGRLGLRDAGSTLAFGKPVQLWQNDSHKFARHNGKWYVQKLDDDCCVAFDVGVSIVDILVFLNNGGNNGTN